MLDRLKFDLYLLVNKMLDQIPQDVLIHGTILDPAIGGGQFVKEVERRKRLAGKTDAEIRSTVFGIEENILCLNYAVNKHKLVGTYSVGNFLEKEILMKFDVVLGNPPFQDSVATSSKKLWPKFVVKGMNKLLNDDGFLAMITPASWMAGNSEIFTLITNNQCEYLDVDVSMHFPAVGSTFSAYVLQKTKVYKPTKLATGGEIDLASRKLLPKNLNELSISIFDKISKFPSLGLTYDSFCHSQRTERVSDSESQFYKYPIKHGANSILWSTEPHPAQNKRKIMMYMSGNPKPYYDNKVHGISEHQCYLEVKNKAESAVAIKYLSSALIKFLISQSTFAQAWNKKFIKVLPSIDLTRDWANSDLYVYFNLTDDEITYVESNVK